MIILQIAGGVFVALILIALLIFLVPYLIMVVLLLIEKFKEIFEKEKDFKFMNFSISMCVWQKELQEAFQMEFSQEDIKKYKEVKELNKYIKRKGRQVRRLSKKCGIIGGN